LPSNSDVKEYYGNAGFRIKIKDLLINGELFF